MSANIFFSKGSIRSLVEKESLLKKSTQNEKNETENVEFRLENSNQDYSVLKIVDFALFDTEIILNRENNQTRYGLVIFDGVDELTCTIEYEAFQKFIFKDQGSKVDPEQIKGHFFCLLRYKTIAMEKFLKTIEYNDYILKPNKPEKIISITKLQLIGKITDSTSTFKKENRSTQTELPFNKENYSENVLKKGSHLISELNCSLSKTSWSIKSELVKKTLIREFENRQNGSNGYVIRCLFSDIKKDFIELVAFNKFCSSKPFKMLQEGNIYIVSNGDIKQSKINLKSWPEVKSVSFEIHVNQQTEFILCDDLEFCNNNHENTREILSQPESATFASPQNNKLYEKFTPISQICLKPIDCFIDILVILKDIGSMKKLRINSKAINIRNVHLTDSDFDTINTAFWGKQAEDFNYNIGACLLFNKIKVSNYGGRSLSVMRQTEIFEIKADYDIEPAKRLIDWWKNKKTDDQSKQGGNN